MSNDKPGSPASHSVFYPREDQVGNFLTACNCLFRKQFSKSRHLSWVTQRDATTRSWIDLEKLDKKLWAILHSAKTKSIGMKTVGGRQAWKRKGTFSRDYFHFEKQTEIKLKKTCLSAKQNYVVVIEIRSFCFQGCAIQEIRPGNLSNPVWILKSLPTQDRKIIITPG